MQPGALAKPVMGALGRQARESEAPQCVVMHECFNSSTQEVTVAEGSGVQGWPVLHETLSQKETKLAKL